MFKLFEVLRSVFLPRPEEWREDLLNYQMVRWVNGVKETRPMTKEELTEAQWFNANAP